MTKVFCVALAGGVGSGKSTVADCFERLGVEVIDADALALQLTQAGTDGWRAIVKHFGPDMVQASGELDRKALRHIIFQDSAERLWLEHLLHPAIRKAMRARIAETTAVYCLLVIPLLNESKRVHYPLHRICVVQASEPVRIQRVMERDAVSEREARAMIAAQCSEAARLEIADDVIHNEGSFASLEQQVLALHQQYLALAQIISDSAQ